MLYVFGIISRHLCLCCELFHYVFDMLLTVFVIDVSIDKNIVGVINCMVDIRQILLRFA